MECWEDEMVREMMKRGLSESEAWSRMEKIDMELAREESGLPWRVEEELRVAENILKEKGWKVKFLSWKGKPDEHFNIKFEVISKGKKLEEDYWKVDGNIVEYYWWY